MVAAFRADKALVREIAIRRKAEDRNHSNFMRRAVRFYLTNAPKV